MTLTTTPPVALSVAGTDSGGAAGLAADLTTFAALGVHGAMAVTAVTAQDTTGVRGVTPVPADAVVDQIEAVLDDLPVAAVKTGMLGGADTVHAVAKALQGRPLVVDPVLVASSGAVLGDDTVLAAYLDALLPAATVITPNRHEAARLLGRPVVEPDEVVDAAVALQTLGPAVVVTGGNPDGEDCADVLVDERGRPHLMTHRAVPTSNDHGTGCTFSAALAASLAHGCGLHEAAREAQEYVGRALRTSQDWRLGRGRGTVAHTQVAPG
jgi:hydroxymethylpyrimidine/phosphomethylpyrimidine kinase